MTTSIIDMPVDKQDRAVFTKIQPKLEVAKIKDEIIQVHTTYITRNVRPKPDAPSLDEYAQYYAQAGYSPSTINHLLVGISRSSLYDSTTSE